MMRNRPNTICTECHEPCGIVLDNLTYELPDRDQNGMTSRSELVWVSDCCQADYDIAETP